MARTGENIYKRKDGRWEGRYIKFHDALGKPKYGYIYAKTYSEAKQILAEHRCCFSDKREPISSPSVKYDEILSAWLETSKINIKESTFAKYSQIVDRHIRPALGHYPLSKISTQLVEKIVQQKLNEGRLDGQGGLSPKTVTDLLVIIKKSVEYAKDHGIALSCNLRKLTIKRGRKEMRVFTQLEQEALIRVLLDELDLYKFGIMLSLYTGIRLGELCALRWEDIYIETAMLKVRRTMQRIQDKSDKATSKTKVIITEPKCGPT